MLWRARVVLVLALIEAGWLAFDGAHAFITGDYVTPSSGPYAGQLGPWSNLVAVLGLEPRSNIMKSIHLGLGLSWLVVAVTYARRQPWATRGMLICAVLGLWYLPFGTLLSAFQIVLLGLETRSLRQVGSISPGD